MLVQIEGQTDRTKFNAQNIYDRNSGERTQKGSQEGLGADIRPW